MTRRVCLMALSMFMVWCCAVPQVRGSDPDTGPLDPGPEFARIGQLPELVAKRVVRLPLRIPCGTNRTTWRELSAARG